jgi:hypothetical protein
MNLLLLFGVCFNKVARDSAPAHVADLYAKSRHPQGREKTVMDSAMGRNGGNSRSGPRIDVHEDTAKLPEDFFQAPPLSRLPIIRLDQPLADVRFSRSNEPH